MRLVAKSYLVLVIAAGALVLAAAAEQSAHFHFVNTAVFLVVVVMAGAWKVPLPGIKGTLSVGFVFKLAALAELNAVEILLVATVGVPAQTLWKPGAQQKFHQLAFNLSAVWVAIYIARQVFAAVSPWTPDIPTAGLVTAAAIYFVVNTGIVSLIIALTERKTFVGLWQESYLRSFPYYLVGGGVASMFVLSLRHAGWATAVFVLPIVYLIHCSFHLYVGQLEAQKEHAADLSKLHLRTIEALAMAIEAKDQPTHDHVQRVKVYAEEIGKELGLDKDTMQALRAASLLHDIGTLAVPEHIIGKFGDLTEAEFEKVKIHPVVGAEILERIEFPYPVAPIVRAHHERWDGKGYPDGIAGEKIPIGARIISMVDRLDELLSDRRYRLALPLDEALGIVVSESGKAFDPKTIEVLERCCPEPEALARREAAYRQETDTSLSTGRSGGTVSGSEGAGGSANSYPPVWSSIASARREAQLFFELTRQLGSSLRLEETLTAAAEGIAKLVPFDTVVIYLCHEDVLVAAYASGVEHDSFTDLRIPLGEGLSGWVASTSKPIVNGNPAVESDYLGADRAVSKLRSGLAVPLDGANGVIGVLALYSQVPEGFSGEHLRIVNGISSQIAWATENAIKYQEAHESANEDYLTGLPNARAMFRRLDSELARARRQGTPLALAVCDMDGFKAVNDTRGHIEGNHLLKSVAETLRTQCREYDLVARMGGDEFVLAMPGIDKRMLAQRILEIKSAVNGLGDSVSISVGAALFPDDGSTTDVLLVEADSRMFADKQKSHRHRDATTEQALALPIEVR